MRLGPVLIAILLLFGVTVLIGLLFVLLVGDAGEGCRYTGPGYVCP